jgi:hypothetical protein
MKLKKQQVFMSVDILGKVNKMTHPLYKHVEIRGTSDCPYLGKSRIKLIFPINCKAIM